MAIPLTTETVWIAASRRYRIVNDHAPGTVIMLHDIDRDRPALLPLAFWKAEAASATLGQAWTGPTTEPPAAPAAQASIVTTSSPAGAKARRSPQAAPLPAPQAPIPMSEDLL